MPFFLTLVPVFTSVLPVLCAERDAAQADRALLQCSLEDAESRNIALETKAAIGVLPGQGHLFSFLTFFSALPVLFLLK